MKFYSARRGTTRTRGLATEGVSYLLHLLVSCLALSLPPPGVWAAQPPGSLEVNLRVYSWDGVAAVHHGRGVQANSGDRKGRGGQ